jgi:hypothetical protein
MTNTRGPEYYKQYYQDNKERIAKRNRELRIERGLPVRDPNKIPDTDAEIRARYYANPKNAYMVSKRKDRVRCANHGITMDDLLELGELQDWCCALCNKDISSLDNNIYHIDHDPETSLIRGLLCPPCNLSLGNGKWPENKKIVGKILGLYSKINYGKRSWE